MKRTMILAFAVLAISATAYAQPMMRGIGWGMGEHDLILSGEYTRAELNALESELGARPFGELSLNELVPYWARVEAAIRKDVYIRSTAAMSMHFPGAGQIRNGDTAEGIGFIAMHAGTIAGTLAGWYYLLPADLRFDKLDYFSSSKETIRDAWMAHSLQDFLPSMGVMFAGMLVDGGIRYWSSISAMNGAKAAVESGTARLGPLVGPGFFGMGMHY